VHALMERASFPHSLDVKEVDRDRERERQTDRQTETERLDVFFSNRLFFLVWLGLAREKKGWGSGFDVSYLNFRNFH
jgi:hypothetical protein